MAKASYVGCLLHHGYPKSSRISNCCFPTLVVAIPSLIILAREIAVSALREWMAQRGERDVVKVGMQGKIKTALTMTALTMLLFVPSPTAPAQKFFSALYQPSIVLLYLSAVITVTSGSVYFRAAAPALLSKK